jgi:hypothetical protein
MIFCDDTHIHLLRIQGYHIPVTVIDIGYADRILFEMMNKTPRTEHVLITCEGLNTVNLSPISIQTA